MSDLDLRELIPHQGSMCLLETVLAHDEASVQLSTTTHLNVSNPLRSAGRLRAVHLCEYGAQAMAVHGALLARASGHRAAAGLLVSLREVHLSRDYIDDLPGPLIVTAKRLQATSTSFQYQFEVAHAGEVIATGRAAVIAQAGAE